MSSFIDNLRRENKAKDNLQYDDGAFYYFFSALTLIVIVPIAISIISQLFKRSEKFKVAKDIPPNLLGHNLSPYLVKKEKSSKINKSLFYKIILAIILVYFYSQVASKSETGKNLKGFDPYEILELERGVTDAELIKKNYRKLSLKYHPDKNPDDPNAAATFLLLTKAYECLTDEKARENWEKYGNPDGQSSFSVGIALPSFLLAKENRIMVLAIFFIILLIIIPYFVLSWYSEVSKYDNDGILLDNKKIFVQLLNENLIVKNCPKVLTHCLEFSPILGTSSSQNKDMLTLHKEIIDAIGKPQVEPRHYKPHHLIHAFLMGNKIGPSLIPDLLFILQHSPKLVDAMIKFALFVQRIPMMNSFKLIGLRCALNLIEFGQHFYQGLWVGDSPLLQLSVLNKEEVDSLEKKKRKLPGFQSLVSASNKKDELGFLPEDKIDSAEKELQEFPKIEAKSEVYVENESEIRAGDIVTIKVTLNKLNYKEQNTDFAYVKSNRYPYNQMEKWYIMVADEKRNLILLPDIATFGKNTYEKTFQFPAEAPGDFEFKLFVRPNGYLGLDYEKDIKFTVLPKGEKRKYEIHPEDDALRKEPTLFDQLKMGLVKPEEDSDEELEEDEAEKKKSENKTEPEEEEKEQTIPKSKTKTE